MSYMKTGTLTIRLDKELDRMLARVSKQSGKSRTQLAREALRRHLRIAQFDTLRRRIMPFADAAGLSTDDDVFSQVS